MQCYGKSSPIRWEILCKAIAERLRSNLKIDSSSNQPAIVQQFWVSTFTFYLLLKHITPPQHHHTTNPSHQQGLQDRRDYLRTDRSAMTIQALFRGSIGRRKFTLVDKLRQIGEEEKVVVAMLSAALIPDIAVPVGIALPSKSISLHSTVLSLPFFTHINTHAI
jgi:hypothetical protein